MWLQFFFGLKRRKRHTCGMVAPDPHTLSVRVKNTENCTEEWWWGRREGEERGGREGAGNLFLSLSLLLLLVQSAAVAWRKQAETRRRSRPVAFCSPTRRKSFRARWERCGAEVRRQAAPLRGCSGFSSFMGRFSGYSPTKTASSLHNQN